ncbi:GTP cyclohydrolase II RibA [Streptomyces pathocidini]|uniref:GTP cyclohydrolase II n=1 Tax=Streptomyces pathocidini TaxID=1650571 RepID=A0ABW7UUW7_9ACTN|nr:GTP cyclohydrolase II RibA [Streptomyces pathocidini]
MATAEDDTVTRLASAPVPVGSTLMQLTVFGRISPDGEDIEEAVALRTAACRPDSGKPPIVRVHSACFTGDVLGSAKCDCGPQLTAALAAIVESRNGILLYMLRHEGRGIGLANKIRAYALQALGHDTISANLALGFPAEGRDFRLAAECLRHLGVTHVRLMTNNPEKLSQLAQWGLVVTDRMPLGGFRTPFNEAYLEAKDNLMGHLDALGAGQPVTGGLGAVAPHGGSQ